MNATIEPNAVNPWAWYQSTVLFPLTTRANYDLDTQLEMDWFNMANLSQAIEDGCHTICTEADRALYLELAFKTARAERIILARNREQRAKVRA